jgi:hypothetical protein
MIMEIITDGKKEKEIKAKTNTINYLIA